MTLYFGAHIGVSDHLLEDVKHLKNSGGNIIQIMLTIKNFRMVTKQKETLLKKLKKYLDDNNMKIVIHSSYTHNLARDWDSHSWWLKNMELELKYAHMLGAIGLVVHFVLLPF
jgi:endonuclease IV